MKIYTEDDKPRRDEFDDQSTSSVKVLAQTEFGSYLIMWYDFELNKWYSKLGIMLSKFQWVYPDEVFKQEKV